jgi:aspartate/glutamate racemase
VPIPNIIDITVKATINQGFQHPLILNTTYVEKFKLYKNAFAKYDINAVSFPYQEIVSEGIEAVKQNNDCTKIARTIIDIINNISSDIDSLIFGCTEVCLLMKSIEHPYNEFVDSNQALADFCWEFATNNLMTVESQIRLYACKEEKII